MKTKVSVIVPVYNVEEYLEKCLDSLVNQTLQDIEIIVVNDGTPDDSQKIIDTYASEYPDKIKGYIKKNGGLSDARNYGMKHATGEYIGFVDSDDYVDVTMYEKLYNKAIEEDSEVVMCGYFKVDNATHSMASAQIGNEEQYNQSAADNPLILEMSAPYAWNKLVKKSLFDKSQIIFPKGYIYEDIPTMYLLMALANNVSKVNEELVYYIVERTDSITATFSRSKCLIMDSLKIFNDRFIEHGVFEQFRDQLVTITLRHIYFRLLEFHRFEDKEMKLKIIKEGFGVLDKYFPDWRKNSGNYIYFGLAEDRNVKRWFYKRKFYWNFVARQSMDTVTKWREWDQSRRHPHREYRYDFVKYLRELQIKENRVLIESFHGRAISDSPYYIMKELISRGGYEIYCTTNDDDYEKNKTLIKENKLNVKLVRLASKKYYEVLATAKYIVNNVSLPLCYVRREGQIYLNTWHGTPLKTLGKNMKKGIESMYNIQHNFLQASYLLFPNEYTKDCIMEDYNLNSLYTGKTILGGYPRNCVFSDSGAAEAVKRQCGLEGKTVYAYMPTWRGAKSYTAIRSNNVIAILDKMEEALDEDHLMFVNLHPNTKDVIDYDKYKYIKPFPAEIPNYDFINCTDALITDYSSIFFDYSITKKPIILFMYDYEDYMDERGMYFDVKKLPFEKVYDIDKLCDIIKTDSIFSQDYSANKEYFDKILKYESLEATKNLVDCVFDNKINNVKVEDYSFNKDIPRKVCIQMQRIDEKEQFDKFIEENNGENVIFVIRNLYFHALMNKWFYEEYNAKVNYVIFGYCKMITKSENEIWQTDDDKNKPKRRKIKKRAREMAFQRTLPNLNIINKNDNKRII